jgi:hypothetical protein
MAKEPEDVVVRILREIQATLGHQGRTLDHHTRELEKLGVGQKEIRESIVTALGLSAHANVRNDLMEDRIGKIEAMIDEFENLKARVSRLESQDA